MQQDNTKKFAYDNVYDSYDPSYDYTIYENDFVFVDEYEEESDEIDETEQENNINQTPMDHPGIESNFH